MKLEISTLTDTQLDAADRIFRLAFGTRNGLADPMKFDGDAARIQTRFLAKNVASFAATVDNELIATSFGTTWGSFAWLGPLSVHPDYWNKHIAQVLLESAVQTLDQPIPRHQALFTVAESPKHLGLYRKFGFFPWFITALMTKRITHPEKVDFIRFSDVSGADESSYIKDLLSITDSIYPGLDVTQELLEVKSRALGDTVIVMDGGKPSGFAICHFGPGTETNSGTTYIKFGCVSAGSSAAGVFNRLLSAAEYCAWQQGLPELLAGVNTGRRGAYGTMLNSGFRSIQQGVAMHRPDDPAYDRADVYAIDDWR